MPRYDRYGLECGNHIVNCARGGIINEADLAKILKEEKIAGAAIDVYSNEPAKDNILFNNPKILLTPHIAASTNEAQSRIGHEIVSIVQSHSKGETPDSCLNK